MPGQLGEFAFHLWPMERMSQSRMPSPEDSFHIMTTRMQRKIALVTGAEGFIGSHLVRFLQAKQWKVIGGYCFHGRNSFPELPNLNFVQCDLRNGQRVAQ